MKKNKLFAASMMLILFIVGFDIGSFQLILLRIAEEFDLTYTQMSSLTTVKCVANFLCVILVGPLSDRVGKIKILLWACIFYIAGCVLAVCTNTITIMYVAISLIGMPFGLCEALSSAALSDRFEDKREQAIILSQGFCSFGAVIGPLFTDFMMQNVWQNWRITFLSLAIVMAFAFVMLVCFGREERPIIVKPIEGKGGHGSSAQHVVLSAMLLIVAMMFYAGMENGFGGYVDSIFENKYQKPQISTYALSGFWLAMLLFRTASVAVKNGHKIMTLLASVACAIFIGGIYVSGNTNVATILCVLLGAVCAPIWPLLFSFTLSLSPEHSGLLSTILSASNAIGASLFPILMGIVADFSGQVNSALLVPMVLAIACAAFFGAFCILSRRIRVGDKSDVRK